MTPSAKPGKQSGIILAFDAGKKKTGIAIGNTLTGLARPLAIVAGGRSKQLAEIDAYIKEWQPEQLIVGLPRDKDGAEHQMTRYCRAFAKLLAERTALPVEMVDERYSTLAAKSIIKDEGESDEPPDSTAAAIILQDFLRQRKRLGEDSR